MTRLLVIDASPNTASSASRALTRHFVARWLEREPDAEVTHRDIGRMPPPLLDQVTIEAFYIAPEDRTEAQCDAVAISDILVDELHAADVVVIGDPMHNFGISGALKAYLDQVARVGRTFRYTESGPEGLLKGRRAFVLTGRGGSYSPGSPVAALDHQTPYLRTVLGFLGIENVQFVHADRQAAPAAAAAARSAATAAIDERLLRQAA